MITKTEFDKLPKHEPITFECLDCKESFTLAWGTVRTSLFRPRLQKCNRCLKGSLLVKCKTCNKGFRKQKNQIDKSINNFCSQSCAATYNNTIYKKRYPNRLCLSCNKKVPAGYKQQYCTTNCRQEHDIQKWLQGELDGSWKYTHANYVRRYLEQRSNKSCEICGENRTRPIDDRSILQVDHIDGNWQNNKPNNVRLLCPTCHALTDNYGALNMGNGRKWKTAYKQF